MERLPSSIASSTLISLHRAAFCMDDGRFSSPHGHMLAWLASQVFSRLIRINIGCLEQGLCNASHGNCGSLHVGFHHITVHVCCRLKGNTSCQG